MAWAVLGQEGRAAFSSSPGVTALSTCPAPRSLAHSRPLGQMGLGGCLQWDKPAGITAITTAAALFLEAPEIGSAR